MKKLKDKEKDIAEQQFGSKSAASLQHSDFPENEVSAQNRSLDTLSRLLDHEDYTICTAVSYSNNKLLISNNTDDTTFAKSYINILTTYLNDTSEARDDTLFVNLQGIDGNYFTDIYNYCTELSGSSYYEELKTDLNKQTAGRKEVPLELSNRLNLIRSIEYFINNPYQKEACQTLLAWCYAITNVQQPNKNFDSYANLASNIVRPFDDFEKLKKGLNRDGNISQEVIDAIKNNNVQNNNFVEYLNSNNSNIHAEMKILQYLVDNNRDNPEIIKGIYIGISKLTCCPCNIALNLLLGQVQTTSVDTAIFSGTATDRSGTQSLVSPDTFIRHVCRGTHGATYTWEPPECLLQDPIFEQFSRQLHQLIDNPKYRKGPTNSAISPPRNETNPSSHEQNISTPSV